MKSTLQRSWLAVLSLIFGGLLLWVLVQVGQINVRQTLERIGNLDWIAFAYVVVLLAINTLLSTQRWRAVDRAVRNSRSSDVPWATCYALTTMGVLLGQLLPVQVSMPATRTIGTWVRGQAFRRGTVGTLFEQSFDVVAASTLAIGSFAVHLLAGGPKTILSLDLMLATFSLLLVRHGLRIVQAFGLHALRSLRITRKITRKSQEAVADLLASDVWNPQLGRKLLVLSYMRFLVFVLMSMEVAKAVHTNFAFWQFAAAVPFVILSTALAVTPGGLGVNELTFATGLALFGVPLTAGAAFALANRLLIPAAATALMPLALAWSGTARWARKNWDGVPRPLSVGSLIRQVPERDNVAVEHQDSQIIAVDEP